MQASRFFHVKIQNAFPTMFFDTRIFDVKKIAKIRFLVIRLLKFQILLVISDVMMDEKSKTQVEFLYDI